MLTFRFARSAAVGFVIAALASCDRSHESGADQKAIGHAETAIGDLTGDSKLRGQGKHDEVVGGVKSAAGELKDAAQGAVKK